VERRTSYLRGVRTRLPYAVVVGLLALLVRWWLRDLRYAVGLALAAALIPVPEWPVRGDHPERRRPEVGRSETPGLPDSAGAQYT
jgi:hypothetical protein